MNKSFALQPINDDYCREEVREKSDIVSIDRKLVHSI